MKGRSLDKETEIISRCIDGNAAFVATLDVDDISWDNVLRRASANRVLYLFAKNLLKMQKNIPPRLLRNLELIMLDGDAYLDKLMTTIEFLNSFFSNANEPYLIVKTYRTLPYITLDVDVLVKRDDLEGLGKALTQKLNGSKLDRSQMQMHIKSRELLTIDFHKGSFWQADEYIDQDFMWKNYRTQDIQGVECPVPALDAEVALTIAHILHERLHVTLLEFAFIKHSCREVNWDIVLKQAERNGWYKLFLRFVSLMNELNSRIYPQEKEPLINEDQFGPKKIVIPRSYLGHTLAMPYMYQVPYASELFLERLRYKKHFRVHRVLPYYFYATFRYYRTKKQRPPIYDHWFSFNKLK